MTNIKEPEARGRPRQRVASAGAKTIYGKPIDFQVRAGNSVSDAVRLFPLVELTND